MWVGLSRAERSFNVGDTYIVQHTLLSICGFLYLAISDVGLEGSATS